MKQLVCVFNPFLRLRAKQYTQTHLKCVIRFFNLVINPTSSPPHTSSLALQIIDPKTIVCSTSKGIYLKTKQLLSDAIIDALDGRDQPLVFLSGPSFAKEIMENHPTAVVCASKYLYHAGNLD